jgi:hypothetical protein
MAPARTTAAIASPACLRTPVAMHRAPLMIGLALLAAALLAGCGNGPTKTSRDLTFYLTPTASPATIADKQDYVLTFNVFDADELGGHIDNVAWTVSRDGAPNVFTGTIATIASRQWVPVTITDNQPVGAHTYVITIDPANTVNEISEDNNSRVVAVTVLPLVIE